MEKNNFNLMLQNNVPLGYVFDENGTLTENEALWCVTCGKVDATKEEYEAKLVENKAEEEANQYQKDRTSALPSIGDQMDMQYWDQVNSTTTWKDAIAKVKSDNPKD